MKPIITIPIVIYFIIMAFLSASVLNSPMNAAKGYDTSNMNISDINVNATTGIFAIDVWQILGFIFFGLGLPATVPFWFAVCFAVWQSLITICFVISLWA